MSSFGRVRSLSTKKIRKETDNRGYKYTGHIKIHRLVASTFIPNPQNLPQINHKDGNKGNNHVDNLEWCSAKYNMAHSRVVLGNKYCGKHVLCVETGDVFESTKDFERKTNRCSAAIRRVLCGQAKRSCGYHWQYTDKPVTNIDAKKYKKHTCQGKENIAKQFGISKELLRWRLLNGWSIEDIRKYPPNLANRYIRLKNS